MVRNLFRTETRKVLEINYYYCDDEESQEFPVFVGWERHFQRLAGPINVSIDLKYDVCACEYLCMAYLLESGEVTAGSLY